MKRANDNQIVTMYGKPMTVIRMQEFSDDDPVVREYPWLFTEPVEAATAAPGEKRAVRRK